VAVWDAQMDVHAKGVFLARSMPLPRCGKMGGGVDHLMSRLSTAWWGALPHGVPRCQRASGSFTKPLPSNTPKRNIRVNSVHPGYCETSPHH